MSTITIFHTEKIRKYIVKEIKVLHISTYFCLKWTQLFRTHRFNSSRQRGASFLQAKWQVAPSHIARCY